MKIKIANPHQFGDIDNKRIRAIATGLLEEEGVRHAEISIAFVDNPTIHRLNKQFLQHDEPTDVLSFPLSDRGEKTLCGELVIGVEVAQAVAKERGHDAHIELALYVIHGLLHLCGEDDKTEEAAQRMRECECYYLEQFGYPDITDEM